MKALWIDAKMIVEVDELDPEGGIKFRVPVTRVIEGKSYEYFESMELDEPDQYKILEE